jgi:hypothetical protein
VGQFLFPTLCFVCHGQWALIGLSVVKVITASITVVGLEKPGLCSAYGNSVFVQKNEIARAVEEEPEKVIYSFDYYNLFLLPILLNAYNLFEKEQRIEDGYNLQLYIRFFPILCGCGYFIFLLGVDVGTCFAQWILGILWIALS